MRADLVIRAAIPSDREGVVALNNSAVPHVNAPTDEQFSWLISESAYYRVAELDGRIAGFVLAVPHGTAYWSDNYKWFTDRYDRFLYVDRLVVGAHARRAGVGRALYRDLATFARDRWPRVTLEVNVRPPNPGSIAFHEAMGFRRVGGREFGDYAVAMYVLSLSAS